MKKVILVAAVIGMVFTSCKNEEKKTESQPNPIETPAPDNAHNTRNSVDWSGTYQGTLPCADCEGIESTIVLKDDNTYSKEDTYLGKTDGTFAEKGKLIWSADGNHIRLVPGEGGEAHNYKVTEGSIILLNQEGEVTTGELADKYVLKKQ